MTHLQAISIVEKMAGSLSIQDRFGEVFEPHEAVVCILKDVSEVDYDTEKFSNQEITPEEYVARMRAHVETFNRQQFLRRMDKKLLSLRGA